MFVRHECTISPTWVYVVDVTIVTLFAISPSKDNTCETIRLVEGTVNTINQCVN